MKVMNRKFARLARLTALTVLVMLMTGCSSGDENADIKAFIAEVDAKPKGRIAPLPEFASYEPFTYGTANRRSPFEEPIIVPPKSAEQRRNVGVKPPQDHVKQFLERFNFSSLTMVGTLEQSGGSWALVQDAEGGVHRVQVGDFMGTSWGQIESINDTRIDLTEIVNDGAGGWLRRPRTLELKGLVD
ncbi:MAG: type IV pilus assembly protein PilP [Candidatus Pseudothioglobus sp.]|jgi:type IV pilus assembly protein PilP